jgi:hypothetical protein
MDSPSTILSALGGTDIYGEADILWYVQDDPNRDGAVLEEEGQFDLLHIQSILSGQRMPVILTPYPARLMEQAKGEDNVDGVVWVGNILPGAPFCDLTVLQDGKMMVPTTLACRYVNCDDNAKEAFD